MAERFTGQRCQDCQGGLIFNKKDKYWECPYCGKIYERELRFDKVQIDGLAGINDLVRSTLLKLILLDFDGAEKELLECEKINHTSIGTLIASISVSLFKSFYMKDRQQELSKANNLLQKLNRDFAEIDEPEEILYDFIDSSDIYALLYVVYSMTNQTNRKEMVFDLLDCEEVYNANIIKYLLSTMLKEQHVELADILIEKLQGANCRAGISTVLTSYPSNSNKASHIEKLLSKVDAEIDLSKMFDSYFASNNDEVDVVSGVFMSAISHNINFDTSTVIHSVLKNCSSVENATKMFKAIGSKRLDEDTANAILLWCINECEDCTISEVGFKSLFDSNSVFEITDQHAICLLQSNQQEDTKRQKIIQMLSIFKISSKNLDRLLAYHLIENFGSYEYRKSIFDEISSRVVSVPLNVVEKYTLQVSFDTENKHCILQEVFSKSKNVSLGAGVVSQYLMKTIDTPETRDRVIYTLLSMKLMPDPESVSVYLLNQNELHSDDVLDLMISQSCKSTSKTFDQYLASLKDYKLFNPKIARVATQFGYVLSPESFAKYLLNAEESGSSKITLAKKYYEVCSHSVKTMELITAVNGIEIRGNIAQVYLLDSKDDLYVMQEIIKELHKEKIRLDANIEVVSSRKKIKMRKFIDANEMYLSKKIETLAQQLL